MEEKDKPTISNKTTYLIVIIFLAVVAIGEGAVILRTYMNRVPTEKMSDNTKSENTMSNENVDEIVKAKMDSMASTSTTSDSVIDFNAPANADTPCMTKGQEWWCTLPDDWKRVISSNMKIPSDRLPTSADVAEFMKIEKLNLSPYKRIDNLNPIANLPNLKELNCSGLAISSLDPISNLTNLAIINCSRTKIKNIDALKNLKNLEKLIVSDTRISSIEPLRQITGIKKLEFAGTQVKKLDPVSHWQNLTVLDCSRTKVSSLKPISNLINLVTLNCSDTQVSSLLPLFNLAELVTLYCFNTKVGSLDPLYNLGKLNLLYYNSIRDDEINDFKAANTDCTVLLRGK